jgi:Tol biopolymer transport system component
MQINPGTRLGPYEIVSPIGAGGMGEVYRARDTRLDRDVAIKVLAGHLTASPEVRQRFEREARAVSSLNHPNICTLHDVGHEDGVDFLVLEYIEGESLQDRIARGAIPMRELLVIGIQIADALDRAHHQNLIHRDLKPGNIMLTPSGAKLLDFGLARSAELGAGGDLTQSPTMARSLTAEGAIIGTFQYMAPEQLEGRPADARTDIFSFGAVLYEMATGRRAFQGDTQASLIASILKDQPRAIAELQPLTPPAFERVVHRCLEKKPDDRWQTARDLMLELTWIRDAGSQAGVAAPVRARRRSRERTAWITAAVFGAAAIALGTSTLMRPKQTLEVSRFAVEPVDRANSIAAAQAQIKISPDGRSIVFLATDTLGTYRLWMLHLDDRQARPLPGTEDSGLPFWSADSRNIAFFSAAGKLMRMPAGGGTPQVVCAAPDGRGGTWNRDGVIVFAPSSGGPLFKVSADGGVPVQVTQLDSTRGEQAHRFPCFLPDGKHFLYVSLPAQNGTFDTFVGSIDSFDRKLAVNARGAAVYAEPGFLLYGREQSLVAQRFDTKKLEAAGPLIPLGEPPGSSGGWSGSPNLSVSDNGVIVRTTSAVQSSFIPEWDASGVQRGKVRVDDGMYLDVALSPDGTRLAASRLSATNAENTSDIFIIELSRGAASRVTFDPSINGSMIWSPDGRRIAFASNRGGNEGIYVKNASGAGEETPLLTRRDQLFVRPNAWTPDGGTIVYHTLSRDTGYDIWTVPTDGKGEAKPFIVTRFNEKGGAVSPDGRYLAYHSDESGSFETYVVSFPDLQEKYRVSVTGAGSYGDLFAVFWNKGGRELLYEAADGATMMRVPVDYTPSFRAGTPVPQMRISRNRIGTLTGDGKRYFAAVTADDNANSLIYLVHDWPALLKGR